MKVWFESDCINLLDDTKTYIDSLITRKIEDQQKKKKVLKLKITITVITMIITTTKQWHYKKF